MEIIKSQKGFLTILTGKTDMGKSTITVYDCSEEERTLSSLNMNIANQLFIISSFLTLVWNGKIYSDLI